MKMKTMVNAAGPSCLPFVLASPRFPIIYERRWLEVAPSDCSRVIARNKCLSADYMMRLDTTFSRQQETDE